MRPVRFVALSEDGQALVLADEVGRLLALPIDDRVTTATHPDRGSGGSHLVTIAAVPFDANPVLSPRDIQSRIRAGESADDVARVAGVPVDRVLRYAGPVLQERAMLAQHARRTRLKNSDKNATLADVVDGRLAQHGIDTEKISWDAYRREDGTWRVVATWPSGKATAQAIWELDRNRQQVSPHDDMAQYLCAERPTQILGQDPNAGQTPPPSRSGHGLPAATDATRRPSRDPIRAGRDALVAALDRPLGAGPGRGLDVPSETPRQRPAAATIGGAGSAFDEDPDAPKEVPAVPSLAVLRPRRQAPADAAGAATGDKPRKRLPSWDDVLFGGAPAAREN
ncbi:septation protein SepH [Catellatospora sp. KI3]|uniref:septation protein SepH n=1 Tax=Catellatospora sp. KI3 TaxID=3041620 RepID=UPI002482310C|nr:septation protein SepH [Catellatospora sp. KI3]MDI1466382.1 septation protein SepH [Catellatospora sp. KI3]